MGDILNFLFMISICLRFLQTDAFVYVKCSVRNETGGFCVDERDIENHRIYNSIYFEYDEIGDDIYLFHNIDMNITEKCFHVEFFLNGVDDGQRTKHQVWPWVNGKNQLEQRIIPILDNINRCQEIEAVAILSYAECETGNEAKGQVIGYGKINPLRSWLEIQEDNHYFPKVEFGDKNYPTTTWEGIPDFGCQSKLVNPDLKIIYGLNYLTIGRDEKLMKTVATYESLFESQKYKKLSFIDDEICLEWIMFINVRQNHTETIKFRKVLDKRNAGPLIATISTHLYITTFHIVRKDKKDLQCLSTISELKTWSMEDEKNIHYNIHIKPIEKNHAKQAHIDISNTIDKRCAEFFYILKIPDISDHENVLEYSGRSFPQTRAKKHENGLSIKIQLKESSVKQYGDCPNLKFRLECGLLKQKRILERSLKESDLPESSALVIPKRLSRSVETKASTVNRTEIISSENGTFDMKRYNLKNKDCIAFAHIANLKSPRFIRQPEIRILRGEIMILKTYADTTSRKGTYSIAITSIAIGVLCLIIIINVILLLIAIRRKKKQVNKINIEMTKLKEQVETKQALPDWAKDLHQPLESLEMEEEIARGSFGIVYRGKSMTASVAIKTHMNNEQAREDLLNEGELLAKLGYHYNIINLLGVTMDTPQNGNRLLLSLEICTEGCLLTKLNEMKEINENLNDNDPEIFNTDELTLWTYQIAMGMEFLAMQNIIHGDLAARNILLDKDLNVKIGDFGKAHKLNYSNIAVEVEGAQPILWMAPEAVKEKEVTLESDKWSYGMIVWEIFTLGDHPYSNRDTSTNLLTELRRGYRMPQPELCPSQIYQEVILPCWDGTPDLRPSWDDLTEVLSSLANPELLRKYNILRAKNRENYQDIRKSVTTKTNFYTVLPDDNAVYTILYQQDVDTS